MYDTMNTVILHKQCQCPCHSIKASVCVYYTVTKRLACCSTGMRVQASVCHEVEVVQVAKLRPFCRHFAPELIVVQP